MVEAGNSDEVTQFIPRCRHAKSKTKCWKPAFYPLRTLIDVDNLIMTDDNIAETRPLTRHQHQVEVPQKVQPLKPGRPYRPYTGIKSSNSLASRLNRVKTAKEVALLTRINNRIVQH